MNAVSFSHVPPEQNDSFHFGFIQILTQITGRNKAYPVETEQKPPHLRSLDAAAMHVIM